MNKFLAPHSPYRIFAVSLLITLAAVIWSGVSLGLAAMFLVMVLIVIEITFSFDNAIINARVLHTMSPFWQRMFMTIGILIAVFGMRLVFPILVVMVTAGLSWSDVINLALNQPEQYSQELERAHGSISAFGGMFLLMLGLHYFFDKTRDVTWIGAIEKPLIRVGHWWMSGLVSLVVLGIILILPLHDTTSAIAIAGLSGIATYSIIHGLSELFTRRYNVEAGQAVAKTGLAGLTAFIYLEILDASFSFDGVIGAFAITKDVVLIAVGLGVGALWVRSLTLFMVRRKVLHAYRYLEHGAHYTITLLATVLLAGLIFDFPEAIAGVAGLIIIGLSINSSIKAKRVVSSHG